MVAASPRKLRPATGWQMAAWLSICPDEPCAQGWTCWPRWKRNAGPEAVQQQTAARPSAQSTLPINVLPRTPAGSPPQPGLAECNPICRPVSAQLSNVAMYPKHLPLVQDWGAPGLPTNLSGGRAAATFLETTLSQSHPHHHHHHHHHYPPPGPHQQPPLHPSFVTPLDPPGRPHLAPGHACCRQPRGTTPAGSSLIGPRHAIPTARAIAQVTVRITLSNNQADN